MKDTFIMIALFIAGVALLIFLLEGRAWYKREAIDYVDEEQALDCKGQEIKPKKQ